MEIIDTASAARFLRGMAPEWAWLLQQIESDGGYVRFPPQVSTWIANLKIQNYPELYEDEARIGAMMLRAFYTVDEIKALDATLETLSQEGRATFVQEIIDELELVGESFELPKTPGEEKRAQEAFVAMSPEQQKQSVEFMQRFMMAMLAGFYQALSVMVHGEKLTSLVSQAKAGNDKAFAKAVQIDKRILFANEYFKKRFNDAHIEGNHKFTEYIGAHLQRPPYKGKIRHKALYLAFSFLDMAGVLRSLKHKDLLDLCTEAGLDSHANRIDDVKNLSKRLAEFYAFQRRGLDLSTP